MKTQKYIIFLILVVCLIAIAQSNTIKDRRYLTEERDYLGINIDRLEFYRDDSSAFVEDGLFLIEHSPENVICHGDYGLYQNCKSDIKITPKRVEPCFNLSTIKPNFRFYKDLSYRIKKDYNISYVECIKPILDKNNDSVGCEVYIEKNLSRWAYIEPESEIVCTEQIEVSFKVLKGLSIIYDLIFNFKGLDYTIPLPTAHSSYTYGFNGTHNWTKNNTGNATVQLNLSTNTNGSYREVINTVTTVDWQNMNITYLNDMNNSIEEINPDNDWTPQKDHLLFIYHFDGNTNDSSGNGFDFESPVNEKYGVAVLGNASWNDSTDVGYIRDADKTHACALNDSFTLGFWFKTPKSASQGLMDKMDAGGNNGGWRININQGTGQFQFRVETSVTGTANCLIAGLGFNLNEWVHWTVRYNQSNITIWQNGNQVHDCIFSGYVSENACTEYLEVGRSDVGGLKFIGSIDELFLYNISLNDSDIEKIYEAGLYGTAKTECFSDGASYVSSNNTFIDLSSLNDSSSLTCTYEFFKSEPQLSIELFNMSYGYDSLTPTPELYYRSTCYNFTLDDTRKEAYNRWQCDGGASFDVTQYNYNSGCVWSFNHTTDTDYDYEDLARDYINIYPPSSNLSYFRFAFEMNQTFNVINNITLRVLGYPTSTNRLSLWGYFWNWTSNQWDISSDRALLTSTTQQNYIFNITEPDQIASFYGNNTLRGFLRFENNNTVSYVSYGVDFVEACVYYSYNQSINVSLISPPNNTMTNINNQTFSCNGTNELGLKNVTLYSNFLYNNQQIDISNGNDTYITLLAPMTNYDTADPNQISQVNNISVLIKHNLTAIMGLNITSAYLMINVNSTPGLGTLPLYLYNVSEYWEKLEVDWYNASDSANWSTPGGGKQNQVGYQDVSSTGYKTIDITNLVKTWVNGSSPNNGIIILSDESVPFIGGINSFESTSPPILRVNHYDGVWENIEAQEIEGSPLINTTSFVRTNIADGNYTWTCKYCDVNNYCEFGDNFSILIDATPPAITLINPIDFEGISLTPPNNLTFNYSVSDLLGVSQCELWLESALNQTVTTITTDTTQTFNASLNDGVYHYYIKCNDTINNTGVSNITTFIINIAYAKVEFIDPAYCSGLCNITISLIQADSYLPVNLTINYTLDYNRTFDPILTDSGLINLNANSTGITYNISWDSGYDAKHVYALSQLRLYPDNQAYGGFESYSQQIKVNNSGLSLNATNDNYNLALAIILIGTIFLLFFIGVGTQIPFLKEGIIILVLWLTVLISSIALAIAETNSTNDSLISQFVTFYRGNTYFAILITSLIIVTYIYGLLKKLGKHG